MRSSLKLVPLLFLLIPPAFADADLRNNRSSIGGDFVEGREMTTNFSYEVQGLEPVQVAFVIDDTGSMGGEIDDIKDNVRQFFNDLGSDARGSIVTFKDSPEIDQDFTTDENEIENTLAGISADGGGDCEEDAEGGLKTALNDLNWQSGERRIVILVLGAGLHDPDGVRDVADQFSSQGYTAYSVTDDLGCNSASGADAVHEYLPDETGGENYRFGTDWNKILQDISESTGNLDGTLNITVPDFAKSFNYTVERDLPGPNKEYVVDANLTDGEHTFQFNWYPTVNGSGLQIKTGESSVTLEDADGKRITKYFTQTNYSDINFTDYVIEQESVVSRSGVTNISVLVGNKGNVDTIENEVGVFDESNNDRKKDLEVLSPGDTDWVNFSIPSSHDIIQSSEILRARADYDGLWDSEPEGEGKVKEQDESNNEVILGYPPRVSDFKPDEIVYQDGTYRVNYTIQHPEPSTVQGEYEKRVGGELRVDGEDLSKPRDDLAETEELDIDDVEVFYNMSVNLTDGYGARTIFNHSYFVENPPPTVITREPADDGVSIDSPVRLEVVVSDPNDNQLDVRFYDASDGSLIGQNNSVYSDVSHAWDVETLGEEYTWRVEVEDPWDTYSEENTFTKVVGASYRVQTDIDTRYSTVIISTDSQRDLFFRVENRVPFERSLETEVSGAGATIGGESKQRYNLKGGESQEFIINLDPEKSGSETLYVNTTNRNTSTKIVDKLPVEVRDYPTNAAGAVELPGIGVLQFLTLVLGAVSVFFLKV